LTALSQKSLYTHFAESLSLKKRLTNKELEWLIGKIPQGALAHHTFHVLNVFTRTGHHSVKHTIDTMDSCRIGWGTLIKLNKESLMLDSQQLIIKKGKLALKKTMKKICFSNELIISTKDIGSIYTYHWDKLCDQISPSQVINLRNVTDSAIRLANLTL